MKLKKQYAKAEDIPKDFEAYFEEKDGVWKLKIDVEEDAPEALLSSLRKERKAREDLEKKIKKWEGLGKTDEEIAELILKAEQADEDKLKTAGEWDKLRAQMNEKHEAALKAKDTIIAAREADLKVMKGTLESHLIEGTATAAIAEHKGIPTLLLPHVQKHVRVLEENGKYVTQVIDSKGEPRVNSKGEPLSVKEFVEEMRGNEVFGRAFEGNGQSGSGTLPNGGGGGGKPPSNVKKSDFKSEKERATFVDAHGLAAYSALPA